jgi:predicted TIM-barrel fold metal-dependent hydrolase
VNAVDFQLFDADNHYYEAEDAFTRHGDERVKRFVRWMSEGKRRHLFFGNRMNTGVPNPTFNPIAKAGAFHQRLKDLEQGRGEREIGTFDSRRYGELEPLPTEYRDRDARLAVMDAQGVEKVFLFPTLGDCVEHLMRDDPRMAHDVFHAFNLWLAEDWGYHYDERLYAPPYIPVLDPELAVAELDSVLAKGAKVISIRPGPAGGRSPADPVWDPFWARVNESGVLAAYHAYGGPTVYSDAFERMWSRPPVADRTYQMILQSALFPNDRGILDTTIALVLGNLFGRFPYVKIASIEMGCAWVPYALHTLDHAGGIVARHIEAFGVKVDDRPSDIFKEHVYVSPFPEEDVVGLTELIGVDHVLFGSDWPHPEGNIQPADYAACLEKLDDAGIRKIMRDNALALIS